ncbi:MAG: purine-nucleoside/S-methyl-5-thioadenosine phosphorylase / adenosine deaminase [Acidobacteriota bacterium]|jgi:YfiH family protein|nr:purine-nucleoside/S-methyl-5-thioadenosine phosphorylase / adenosine deaminase [Acidobacteriota bacterium]
MPQDALNLAGFNEDAAENIYENRRRFLGLLEGEWTLASCWQMHSADVRVIENITDAPPPENPRGETIYCDALTTRTPRILLGVKTADCVPVLLGDRRTGACAAIHAGWRGTLASIVTRTLERMAAEYGTRAEDVRAAIGPAARACCYEVGSEVIEAFHQKFPESDSLFQRTREGHALVDLHRANREQLNAAGVQLERIHTAPLCTMCRTDLFFSYRREKKLYGRVGRLMSVVGTMNA